MYIDSAISEAYILAAGLSLSVASTDMSLEWKHPKQLLEKCFILMPGI